MDQCAKLYSTESCLKFTTATRVRGICSVTCHIPNPRRCFKKSLLNWDGSNEQLTYCLGAEILGHSRGKCVTLLSPGSVTMIVSLVWVAGNEKGTDWYPILIL